MASPYNLGDDELLSPVFWEGIAEGEFRLQHCRDCGRDRFPPSSFCPRLPWGAVRLAAGYGSGDRLVLHRRPSGADS